MIDERPRISVRSRLGRKAPHGRARGLISARRPCDGSRSCWRSPWRGSPAGGRRNGRGPSTSASSSTAASGSRRSTCETPRGRRHTVADGSGRKAAFLLFVADDGPLPGVAALDQGIRIEGDRRLPARRRPRRDGRIRRPARGRARPRRGHDGRPLAPRRRGGRRDGDPFGGHPRPRRPGPLSRPDRPSRPACRPRRPRRRRTPARLAHGPRPAGHSPSRAGPSTSCRSRMPRMSRRSWGSIASTATGRARSPRSRS